MQASADTGAIAGLAAELAAVLPAGRLVSDPLRRLAYGTDASFYRLVPQLVVIVDDEPELVAVQRACHRRGIPVTYRAAGTSLSGQAVTDSVLVKLGSGWRRHRLGPGAETISLQPGVIGAHANRILAPHGRKIGPDPASLNAAMIGGIAANNASGMCCGTAQNSYRTLVSLRVVLADGTLLDTADGASRDAFRASHGALLDGLAALAARVRGNPELAARIEKKFRIKNTTGYSLNALVDFDDPFEILQHLLIGSEGTLGFIAEITYRTVVEHPHKASALAFFPTIEVACDAATALKPQPVAAVELIDRAGLRSVEQQPGLAGLKGLDPEVCALLVEVRGADAAELAAHRAAAAAVIAGFPTVQPVAFTDVPAEYGTLWNVRKGLLPAVGAMREAGTTVIIEDVAFPIERLSAAVRDLQQLFASYRYDEVILFGHALEGNLHCVFTQDFATAAEVQRYAGLMDGIAALVVGKYDGSLKAEHGTGRNMAPYVEMEWGGEAYALMQQIKALFDPGGLLNPGVILNRNPQVHLENLKPLPAADPIVDKCIECGFCEPDCPSRELTLSPRQRIAGWRELSRLAREEPDHPLRAELAAAWQYQAIDTCAADGLCSLACPVGINTGDLIRALRHDRGRRHAGRARWLGEHFAGVTGLARLGLRAAGAARAVLGDRVLEGLGGGLQRASGGRVPAWHRWLPRAAAGLPRRAAEGADGAPRAVYLPSCTTRTMGPAAADRDGEPVPETAVRLLRKAGFAVVIPAGVDGLCCGMAFHSKGQFAEAQRKGRELVEALIDAARGGADPVLVDTSPCLHHLREQFPGRLELYEPVEFVERFVLPRVTVEPLAETVAVHVTCSARRLGLETRTVALARACASEVVVPDQVGCCGFAGDRGFRFPELNASALQHLRAGLGDACRVGYSTSRTCEIGLSRHAGFPYRSILELVDRATRPRTGADRT